MRMRWGFAVLVGGLVCALAGPALAGLRCTSNDQCARGEGCFEGECVPCDRLRVDVCTDPTFVGTHGCAEQVIADLRADRGLCAEACADADYDVDRCVDRRVMNTVCATTELAAWNADLAALSALRADEPDALLPDDQITSACFRLTQGELPETEEVTAIVPGVPGCLDDDGEPIDGCLEDAGERVVVKRELYGREGQSFTGFSSHYYGLRMQDMTRASSSDPPDQPTFDFDLEKIAWDANGLTVTSCAEYVYESYYDFSVFEDAIAGLGNDYWAIWAVAFAYAGLTQIPGPDGVDPKRIGFAAARSRAIVDLFDPPASALGTRILSGQPLAARNGDPVSPQPTLTRREPNPWFRIGPFFPAEPPEDPDAVGECGVDLRGPTICDPDLHDRLLAAINARQSPDTSSFTWHYRKGAALRSADLLVEEYSRYQRLNDDLAHIRARRGGIVRGIRALLEQMYGAGDRVDNNQVLEEVGVPIPGIDVMLENPALLDPQIDAARPLGAARVARKAAALRGARSAFSSRLGQSVAALAQNEALAQRALSPLELLDFGADGPDGQAYFYYQEGTERSAERPRAAADHLADWRADQPQDSTGRYLPPGLVTVDRLALRLAASLRRLHDVDRELEALIVSAFDAGCYGDDIANPCEWTPKVFVEELLAHYGEREALYQRCLDETAAEGFADLGGRSFGVNLDRDGDRDATRYPYYWNREYPSRYYACGVELADFPVLDRRPDEPGVALPQLDDCFDCNQWNRDTRLVTHYLNCIGPWKRLLLEMVEEEVAELIDDNGNARLLEQKGEWWQLGNNTFGAYAGYGFGWAIGGFEAYKDARGDPDLRCDMTPEMYGHLDLAATVFGGDVAILDASGHMRFGEGGFPDGLPVTPTGRRTVEENQVDLEFLGETIFNGRLQQGDDGFNFVTGGTLELREIFSASATFTIGFVPVTVSAGLSGIVGLSYSLGGAGPDGAGDCTLIEARGMLIPFLAIAAFASASINAVVAEAGVKIELTLVRLDLPFIGRVALEMHPQTVRLIGELKLDLVVTLLSGRVLLFLRLLWETFELELFSWDGPRFSTNIFNFEASVPLRDLATVLYDRENP